MPSKTYTGVDLTIEWDPTAARFEEVDEPEGSAQLVPCRFSIGGTAIACSFLSLSMARSLELRHGGAPAAKVR